MSEPIPDEELRELMRAADAARERRKALPQEPDPPAPVGNVVALRRLPPLSAEELQAREEARARSAEREAGRAERDRAAIEGRARLRLPESFWWVSEQSLLEQRVPSARARREAQALTCESRAVFLGPSGSGKTSLACAAAYRLALGAEPLAFVVETAMALAVARSRHPLGEGEPPVLTRCLTAPLLVLDELGTDELVHGSAVKEVLFERHWHARPTWVTTWMGAEQMAEKYGEGIARRIFEGAVVIDCGEFA